VPKVCACFEATSDVRGHSGTLAQGSDIPPETGYGRPGMVDEPSYLKPEVALEAREAAVRLLEPTADVYRRAADLWDILSSAIPNDAPGRLYVIWAALTDIWELSPDHRDETESLMREAAQEFLAVSDNADVLDGYLSRWYERLDIRA